MTYRALEERKVDLAVARMFKPVADEQMDAEVLYDEQEVVVAGADNSWTRRRKIDLAELMHEPWTLPPPDTLSGIAVFGQQSGDQALARRVADDGKASRDHHLEESHHQSGGTALHRLRPRSCKNACRFGQEVSCEMSPVLARTRSATMSGIASLLG